MVHSLRKTNADNHILQQDAIDTKCELQNLMNHQVFDSFDSPALLRATY